MRFAGSDQVKCLDIPQGPVDEDLEKGVSRIEPRPLLIAYSLATVAI